MCTVIIQVFSFTIQTSDYASPEEITFTYCSDLENYPCAGGNPVYWIGIKWINQGASQDLSWSIQHSGEESGLVWKQDSLRKANLCLVSKSLYSSTTSGIEPRTTPGKLSSVPLTVWAKMEIRHRPYLLCSRIWTGVCMH